MKRHFALIAVVVPLILAACGVPQTGLPLAAPSPSPERTRHPNPHDLFEADSKKPQFDGTIHGWRIAPGPVLEREGYDRNLDGPRGCDARRVGLETRTDLDFTLTYLPQGVKLAGKPHGEKWACGDMGLSVLQLYDFENPTYGIADLRVERSLQGMKYFDLYAAADRVEACVVRELPSVCVHALDDETGLGESTILMIEDNQLDPFVTRFFVHAYQIPFNEVLKIAEGLR